MKKSFILAILCLFSSMALAQQFVLSPADSLREAGDFEGAIVEYARIFEAEPDNRTNTYNYACALALTRQVDTAFHYLNIAVENDSSVQALTDPDFYFLIEDERWATLEDQLIERIEAKHGQYKNLALSKELWRMKLKDQAFYDQMKLASKTLGYESPIFHVLTEAKRKVNEEILTRLEEIIAEHGWPKKSEVKGSAAQAAFLIVQHADLEVQKKYLPMMREAADNEEASWRSLALLIDRVNLREGKQQIYGSQIGRNAEDGTFYVDNLEDPEYVNQRRASVGLGPIQDYVKRWDIEWTIEQKEK